MKKFKFIALTSSGAKQKGSLYAQHREEVLQNLVDQCPLILQLEEEKWWESPRSILRSRSLFSNQELALSCKQFSFLLQSGIPLNEVLHLMVEESTTPSHALFFREIDHSVNAGFRFSESLERWGEVLPRFFIQSVRAGEHSGEWETIFRDLSEFYQKEVLRHQQLKQAMIYPSLLLLVTGIVCYFLMNLIVPQFLSLYVGSRTLPRPTQILLWCYQKRTLFLCVLMGFWILCTFLLPKILSIPNVQVRWSRFLLKVPKLGSFLLRRELTRFSYTFSMLLRHGLEINSTLPVAANHVESIYLRQCLQQVLRMMEEGSSFSSALKNFDFWPSGFIRMIQIGETGNRLDETMKDVATLYELEVHNQIQSWQRMIEPGLLIFISLVVGFLALAVLLPMMDQWQGYQML